MPHIEERNRILLRPSSVSEACLRIQQGMKGAKAVGSIEIQPPFVVKDLKYLHENPPEVISYKFTHVDVTEFYEDVQRHPNGELKCPGAGTSDGWGMTEGESRSKSPQKYDNLLTAAEREIVGTPIDDQESLSDAETDDVETIKKADKIAQLDDALETFARALKRIL